MKKERLYTIYKDNTLNEIVTRFAHGDKCEFRYKGSVYSDARISINSDGSAYLCQDICNGFTTDDKLGYKYSYKLNDVEQIYSL